MNKLIVVTGGSKGIGRAIVEKFAKEGFDIVAISRTTSDLEALGTFLKNSYADINFYYFAADLSDKSQVRIASQYILSIGRNIDVLVNNSGLYNVKPDRKSVV